MSKKKATFVDDLGNAPEEIRTVVAESVRQAKDAVREPSSVVPRIAVLSVVVLAIGLGMLVLRRRK
jgi:hypothetical protein